MSYLPPELALSRPNRSAVRSAADHSRSSHSTNGPDDVGELLYRGPNVMMGYAHGPDDLALGKTVETLRTGDLARLSPDGLYEVVGRNSRFVKMYGLRIDLQRVEAALRGRGMPASAPATTTPSSSPSQAGTTTAKSSEWRPRRRDCPRVPSARSASRNCRLPSGKPDYRTVRGWRADRSAERASTDLRELFADVLQVDASDARPGASFVDLGGNSLSYVDDDRAAGAGDGPAASGLAADVDPAAGMHHEASHAAVGWRPWKPASRCGPRRSCSSSDRTPSCSSCGVARTFCSASPGTTSAASASRRFRATTGCGICGNTIAWIAVPSVLWVVIALCSPTTTRGRICCWPTSFSVRTTA